MSAHLGRVALLRANSLYLLLAAGGGMAADLAGAYLAKGPQAAILAAAPHAAIGFVEAHGLALILGALLWFAYPSRAWHATGAVIHLLLGISNLAFWPIFAAGDMVAGGYITTSLHGLFATLQIVAAITWRPGK